MKRLSAIAVAVLALQAAAQPSERFRLPRNAPPPLYGDVLIGRAAGEKSKAVAFSHWRHRLRYTCRVCHLELDFAFVRNATEITTAANREGAYCGACHDGRTAFAYADEANCARCHTGVLVPKDGYSAALQDLPPAEYGNLVDWSAALARGKIAPVTTIRDDPGMMDLDTTLRLEAEWNFVSPAIFPHKEHVLWLDCANCHPDVFNVKKKGTRHFSMRSALRGEFCGLCHVHVAFPLDDCRRCHPDMKDKPQLR